MEKDRQMSNIIKSTACAIAAAIVLFVFFDYALTGSDVYVSYSTNECVKVDNWNGVLFSAGDYNCENLPPKYNHIWTK